MYAVSGAMNLPKCSADTKEEIRLLITSPYHYLSIIFDFRNCILSFTLEIMIIYEEPSMQEKSRRGEMQFFSVINNFHHSEFGMRINLSKETLKFMPNKCFLQKKPYRNHCFGASVYPLFNICPSLFFSSAFKNMLCLVFVGLHIAQKIPSILERTN